MNPHPLLPLSLAELSAAWTKVWRDLETLGFACPRLATCQVYLGIASTAYGYQWYGDRPESRACGNIILPRFSLSHWADYFGGRPKVSAVEILRHEYGHAYADVNRRRIETKRFENAFGWPHEVEYAEGFEYDMDHHVTKYAAATTGEDFAEVFWLYLKHKGKLPRRIDTAPIRRKWKFVGELRKMDS